MRILVVEDESKIALALKRGLEQELFAVDLAGTGKEAVRFATSEEYDVIVLDRMLPELDGVGVITALRNEGIQTPILMLTAKDAVQDRVSGLQAGADDYLGKPFAFEELLARVRALLRRPAPVLQERLALGDLELFPAEHIVRRAGKEINLSSKEFALLEYMVRNAGRVLTKDQIIAHVWDYDADILPNTVEVYMGYLRTKIDKPFKGEKLVGTVRGVGYRLGGSRV
jgi:DNA-binding response OmpR family regulator